MRALIADMLNKLVVVGVNHDSASVELRERIAFAPEKVHQSLSALIRDTAVTETVILSTCNRTELYGVLPEAADALAVSDQLSQWLASHHQLDLNQILPSIYRNHSVAAASHLVRVAAGLNSMVLGEPQIFGQMKSAFAVAQEAGAVGFHLNLIFPEAFRIAKKVRTDTAIGENPVSVAYAAVDLARQIFRDIDRSTALLLGAGETIELVAKHLRDAGLGKLVIANRTLERAHVAADLAGTVGVVGQASDLATADVVVNTTTVGMGGGSEMPCDPALLHGGQVVVDIVYTPLETAWLAAVREAGIEGHNGLSMLVHQAAIAFTHWTGVAAPVAAMRAVVQNKFV